MITIINSNIKKSLKIVGIIFAIFIISVWIWIATLDLNTQTYRIEKFASEALGRDVKINGQLSFSLSLFPRITIENVHVSNPEWAISPYFLTAEKIEIEISLLSLLENKLVFEDIDLTDATINLQQDPEKGSSWDFSKPNDQQPSSMLITDFVELDAHQITIMYYPADRPPLVMLIDEFRAELSHNQPVDIHLRSKIRGLPLDIDIQGGTFEQLINPEVHWPFKGVLDTDTREIYFDGHITNLITLDDVELKLSSDKQIPRESILFERQFEPLIERYKAKLNINIIDEIYRVKLIADANNFDLSRLYTAEQRSEKPSVKFRDFTIKAEGSGQSINQILHTAIVDVAGSNIDYRHPSNRPDKKFYQASINSLKLSSTKNTDFELLLKGTTNNIPFTVSASSKEILSTLWQKTTTPITVNVDSKGTAAQINGEINHEVNVPQFNGEALMQAGSLTMLGNLLGQKWLETQVLNAQSQLIINNHSVNFNHIVAELGSQKAKGEVSIDYNNGFTLSMKAYANNIDADKIFPKDKIPPQLVFNLEQVSLNMQGKNKSLPQSLFTGHWNITANKGKGGWCANDTTTDCTTTLNNLHLTTRGNEPLKLNAQGLFNQLSFELDAEFGRLKISHPSAQMSTPSFHSLDLKLSTTELSILYQGALHKPFNDLFLQGDLKVKGDLSTITQLENIPLKLTESVDMSAQLTTQRDTLLLTNIHVKTAGVKVNGEFSYQSKQSPKLTVNASGSVNLANYINKSDNTKKNTIQSSEQKSKQSKDEKTNSAKRIVPDISLDYSHYRWLDARVNINDFRINYNDNSILSIDSQFTATNGLFTLGPIKTISTLDDRTTLSSIELDSSQTLNKIKYSIQAKKMDYGHILTQLEVSDEISGEMDIDFYFSGQGTTLRKAVESSNGDLKIVAGKGKVPRWLLEVWGSGFLRSLFPTTWLEDSSTDLNCAVGHLKLENGTIRSQILLTDTKRVTVAGNVVIDLKTELIEGVLKPQPKDATLMHIGTPLRLSGSLGNYKISSAESSMVTLGKWAIGLSNPATIILLFGNTGAKDKNPCETLIKKTL